MSPVNLNWGVSLGASHSLVAGLQDFADRVKEATNGKVTFTLYCGESLLKNTELYTGMLSGACDMVETDPGYSPAYFPFLTLYSQPGTEYTSYYATNRVINKLIDKSAYDIPDLDKSEILFAFNMTTQTGIAFGPKAKKATTLEDMKGVQLRGTGYAINMINAIGATPVGIGMSECYEALQKGTMDAAITSWESMSNWKIAEVCSSFMNLNFGVTSFHIVAMNSNVWNSFPAPVQAKIKEISADESLKMADLAHKGDMVGHDLAVQDGVDFYELSDTERGKWLNCLSGIRDEWIQDTANAGYSQDQVNAWITYFDQVREQMNTQYSTAP
jgi:TRAP-type C4-dicarboxylate transport system substrate-binding protein